MVNLNELEVGEVFKFGKEAGELIGKGAWRIIKKYANGILLSSLEDVYELNVYKLGDRICIKNQEREKIAVFLNDIFVRKYF